jgi:hypothetical protein
MWQPNPFSLPLAHGRPRLCGAAALYLEAKVQSRRGVCQKLFLGND